MWRNDCFSSVGEDRLIYFWWFDKPIVLQGAYLLISPSVTSNLFFRQSNLILLEASAWPLPCGYLRGGQVLIAAIFCTEGGDLLANELLAIVIY